MNEGSSRPTTATLAPGLSRSGLAVSATHRSKDDHAEQPTAVSAGNRQGDEGDRVADATRQQPTKSNHRAENHRAGDPAGHRAHERRRFQTWITCRSLTAPLTVPEYTWLKKKRVPGCRLFNFAAASQLIWLKTSPGPVASTIATSAPFTSLSSGAVDSVSPE